MASVCIHKDNLGKILNYLHPNTFSNIESYKEGPFYLFPSYHGCCFRNGNGTRKKLGITKENSVSILYMQLVGDR